MPVFEGAACHCERFVANGGGVICCFFGLQDTTAEVMPMILFDTETNTR